jgi:hypothetical protein
VRLPVSASDVIQPAFRHAKEQLLQPFRFGQWARLAVVGLLAGEMSSFGGCNFNFPSDTQHRGSHQFFASDFPPLLRDHPALFAGLALALIVVVFVLLVLFSYVSSVMRFILFDSIVARECHIRQGWARRKGPGLRLFLWRLLFSLVMLAALLIAVGIPAACVGALGWFTHARDHVLGLVLAGIALFFVLIVLFVFAGVVSVMTKDFVVPQMALEDIAVMEAWRRLWLWIKYEKSGYAGYIGMKIVLAIGVAIALAIITIIALLILLLIFGGLGAAAVFGGRAAGWSWNPYTISLAVLLGCVALAILIFAAALISVPAIVFFPAYSIYFFAPRYSRLASLLWPETPAPVARVDPPPEPAPL